MMTKFWNVIGLMSGTSLDGLDIIFTKISKGGEDYSYKLIYSETVPYSKEWEHLLRSAFHLEPQDLNSLSENYGRYLATKVNYFIKKHQITKVDFIASHGHTIFHKPEEGYTLQIGDGAILCKETGIDVICDFRTQDVAMGGQGAPLVPIGDQLLFKEYDYCLNLGGFANISYESNSERIAFDICPANIVLNYYAQRLGFDYDKGGQLAQKGTVHKELLEKLNSVSYYDAPIPKSLGYEFVQERIFPIIAEFNLSEQDILKTFVVHITFQIGRCLKNDPKLKLLVTGGGTFNSFLIDILKKQSTLGIVLPDHDLINFKEALVFAFLGVLKNENQVNCLASVTGATKDHSSGKIFRFRT